MRYQLCEYLEYYNALRPIFCLHMKCSDISYDCIACQRTDIHPLDAWLCKLPMAWLELEGADDYWMYKI